MAHDTTDPIPPEVFSHWNTMIDGLDASPQEFMDALEENIKKREIPHTKQKRYMWKEGGIFSGNREYLRVKRKDYTFDICGAPFASGFFVSWWMIGQKTGFFKRLMLSIPLLGRIFGALFTPMTYYQIDTTMMFRNLVHTAVLEVIDEMTNAKSVRGPTDIDRRPFLRGMMAR